MILSTAAAAKTLRPTGLAKDSYVLVRDGFQLKYRRVALSSKAEYNIHMPIDVERAAGH